jgi:hypothetical protein
VFTSTRRALARALATALPLLVAAVGYADYAKRW